MSDTTNSAFATLLVDTGPLPNPTGSYQAVGAIKSIKHSGLKVDPKDTTALDALEATKTFRAGRIDPGDLTINLFYDRDDYATLVDLLKSRQNYNWQIQIPDGPDFTDPLQGGATADFAALITDIPLDIPEDDELMSEVKLKISGPWTFTN